MLHRAASLPPHPLVHTQFLTASDLEGLPASEPCPGPADPDPPEEVKVPTSLGTLPPEYLGR